jgi:hypothetical protein
VEFLRDNSLISAIISAISGQKYTHSGMFMNNYFFELDAVNAYKDEPDYHCKKYPNLISFQVGNPEAYRTELYEVPFDFTEAQIKKGFKWWQKREKCGKIYGYGKLLSFLIYIPFRPVMRWWYRKKGKPYKPHFSSKKTDVCSVAVDKCLKHMGYDIFPEFVEHVSFPGLFARKLKKYKI